MSKPNPFVHCTPKLVERRHQVQSSSLGPITVFVADEWLAVNGDTLYTRWQFSFTPEPGDVMAQVNARLGQ